MKTPSHVVVRPLVLLALVAVCVLGMASAAQAQAGADAPHESAASAPEVQGADAASDGHAAPAGHETGASGEGHNGSGDGHSGSGGGAHQAPSLVAMLPFIAILLCIAILPLIHKTEHWWHHNHNKLLVALVLAAVTMGYYFLRGTGFGHGAHAAAAGLPTVLRVLDHAVLAEYVPFIILLFCLYTICGGIQLRGDLRATPVANTAFLATGAILASFVGTTGASMLLIRPMLQTNKERRHVVHSVVFFIFVVSNIGGCLLPTGDPPLFLGYLKGVPFFWTFHLWKEWLFCNVILLGLYYMLDTYYYRKEPPLDHMLDETQIEPLRLRGSLNFLWLILVVAAVATVVPGQKLWGLPYVVPEETTALGHYVREGVMLLIVVLAWVTSSPTIRRENDFNFGAIVEVAVLFIGIFITMQAPVEILNMKGPELPLTTPARFFWATGALSSFLDNAPTYVVFFETANSLTHAAGTGILELLSGHFIRQDLLVGISLGAVFMGANTYIGNGPNFMVKSIAEQSGVKMPSFFGYMLYSMVILIPLFVLVTFVFLR